MLFSNNSIMLYCKQFYYRGFILINSDKTPSTKLFTVQHYTILAPEILGSRNMKSRIRRFDWLLESLESSVVIGALSKNYFARSIKNRSGNRLKNFQQHYLCSNSIIIIIIVSYIPYNLSRIQKTYV